MKARVWSQVETGVILQGRRCSRKNTFEAIFMLTHLGTVAALLLPL